jgi:uncharacterized lipoprotein YmbA
MKFSLLVLLIPLIFGACSVLKPVKDTSVNHLLDPLIPERKITGATPAIAVSRPSLPSYLDRQQLVSRSSDGQVQMNSYHLWAEPLDAAISRVTSQNLDRLTNSLNIQPVENFVTLDYQSILEIRISRFEPDANGQLLFECTWKIQPVHGGVANTHSFNTKIPLPAGDSAIDPAALNARVLAMDQALAQLSREIARSL